MRSVPVGVGPPPPPGKGSPLNEYSQKSPAVHVGFSMSARTAGAANTAKIATTQTIARTRALDAIARPRAPDGRPRIKAPAPETGSFRPPSSWNWRLPRRGLHGRLLDRHLRRIRRRESRHRQRRAPE